jgi:transcription elongation factor Elf1
MGRPYTCPYCGQVGKSVSKGVRKTKTIGDRRIRFCKACHRKFTPKNQKQVDPQEEKAVPAVAEPVANAEPAKSADPVQAQAAQ